VYKTLRTRHLQDIPRQVGLLIAYMTGGLVVLGVALWLIQVWALRATG
jgi:hypothetical protein